ncbi:hypothetical protein NA56DRAFT_701464 [Hyaloscypha hepaticicola]|uniref:Uncharacterized protein n=1 Tax=Hyaloscypha hepaticicola TaxID=2082293 RepID=A0A2J6QA87_9HELO|nr:hypothetical protein NA56DRAFT_701464 [Hyaloscypha hepaticicola]
MKEGEEEPMLAALWPSMVFETVDIEHISAMMAEVQVTGFDELTAEIGVIFLSGKLDVSIDVTVKPEFINAFDVNTSFDISNQARFYASLRDR